MRLELISSPLCPYVQRSVIVLLHKGIDHQITHVDLDNRPEWLRLISPLGKVPLLRVDGSHIIFESSVITEFLDETTEPRLHPSDPMARAHNRSWIEYGSSLLMDFFVLTTASDEPSFSLAESHFFDKLDRLENILRPDPFFNGPRFSLVDAAYAPLFVRLELVQGLRPFSRWDSTPKLNAWSQALLGEPAVRGSVLVDFRERFMAGLRKRNSVLVG
jgi:glutathione S-transferase